MTRKGRGPVPLAITDDSALLMLLEAILFVGSQPLSLERIASLLPSITPERVDRLVGQLRERYAQQRRPYTIIRSDAGYQMELLPRYRRDLANRLRSDRGVKLSRPVIEVLSIVAYRQPIDRAGIESLLGDDPNTAIRQLVRRQLIAVSAATEEGESRYITTPRFLEVFGLASLGDLPTSEVP